LFFILPAALQQPTSFIIHRADDFPVDAATAAIHAILVSAAGICDPTMHPTIPRRWPKGRAREAPAGREERLGAIYGILQAVL